jgi:choline kinase
MTGVILAAGLGTRLNGGTAVVPKCLAAPDGERLLDRQLNALKACGVDDIVVVVGFQADEIRAACRPGVRFVENPIFAETNSLYSLWLARTFLSSGFVVLNCDVLFHPRLLIDLLDAHCEDALLVAYRNAGDAPYGDEEMKVKIRRGLVVDIAKTLPPEDADAENVGIAKFGPRGARQLAQIMDRLVAAGAAADWAPRSFREFALDNDLFAVSTRGLPWIEIDTAADYRRAAGEVAAAIKGAVEMKGCDVCLED